MDDIAIRWLYQVELYIAKSGVMAKKTILTFGGTSTHYQYVWEKDNSEK